MLLITVIRNMYWSRSEKNDMIKGNDLILVNNQPLTLLAYYLAK